jgi:hypothetical protein
MVMLRKSARALPEWSRKILAFRRALKLTQGELGPCPKTSAILRATVFVLFLLAVFFTPAFCGLAAAQVEQGRGPDSGLTVHVLDVRGGPLPIEALVTLTSFSGSGSQVQATNRGSDADFTHISPGVYTVQVTAAGYQTARQDVSISKGGTAEAFISISPAGQSTDAKPYPGVPLLTGKARKELDAAMQLLEAHQVTQAALHVANALKSAPAHPDVLYVAGLCAVGQKDWAAAQNYESAVGI